MSSSSNRIMKMPCSHRLNCPQGAYFEQLMRQDMRKRQGAFKFQD